MRVLLMLLLMFAGTGLLAAAPVTFGDRLNAKFHHERCLSCHQFNTRAVNGRAYTSHRSRYNCVQCHRPDRIGLPPGSEWMAPNKMDYTGFSAAATCRLIKQRMGSDPGGQKLVDHLLHDGRILWALDSGITPAGRTPTVPGGYAEWQGDVEAWVRDGMRCE
jgi:cytochrome c551/c552